MRHDFEPRISTAMVEITAMAIAVPARIRMKIARGSMTHLPCEAARTLSATNRSVKKVKDRYFTKNYPTWTTVFPAAYVRLSAMRTG